MKKLNLTALAAVAGSLLIGTSSSLAGTTISANFIGRGASGTELNPLDVAGVVPQPYWANIATPPNVATTPPLLDSAGNFTSVQLNYDSTDSWSSDGPMVTPNDRMMKGIFKFQTAGGFLKFKNLPAGTYDVYAYLEENGTGAEGEIAIGTATNYVAWENSFPGTFTQVTGSAPGNYIAGANYAKWAAVAAAGDGTITITGIKTSAANDGVGVAGLQLVQVSGSAYGVNTNPCSITANPVSTLALAGNPVTFTVGASGPYKVQWKTNGVDIPGAINLTYTLTTSVADNGKAFSAVVYNNVNTNTSTAAILEVDAPTPPVLTQGFLTAKRWNDIGGTVNLAGLDVVRALLPGGANPASPSLTFYLAGPNLPDQGIDNYGAEITGWVKPTVTGDYDFFLTSDDASELFLNPVSAGSGTNTLPNPVTDAAIAWEYGNSNPFAEPGTASRTTASPIHLEAGKLYGLSVLFKEGGGGDYVRVAWRLTTDTTPAAKLQPISAFNCWTLATSAGHRAALATQPKNVTVFEGAKVTFSTSATLNPTTDPYGVQWYSNNVALADGSGPKYVIKNASLAYNGKQYKAKLLTLAGALDTTNATLTVLPDTNAPVPSAGAIVKQDGSLQVGVGFDETVNPAGLVAGNFTLVGATGAFKVVTNSLNTYKGPAFTVAAGGLVPGTTYKVNVKNVADAKGNAIPAAGVDAPFTLSSVAHADPGTQKRPGDVVPAGNGGFDVLNGGRGEWGTYDEFTLAYVKKTNDFDVKVQVIYAEPSSQWGRVGLHARNALDIGQPRDTTTMSAYAQTHVNPTITLTGSGVWDPADPIFPGPANATSNNGHEQNQRLTAGAATTGWGSGVGTVPEYPDVWLRLSRTGDTIHGYRGEDGVSWTDQGTTVLTDQQAEMYVGMSLTPETANIAWTGHDVWVDPYDPAHDLLFVAQFRNFGNTSSPAPTPTISFAKNASGQLVITYVGTLVASVTVNGTYTPVAGATSPYIVPTTGAAMFFRAQQ